MLTDGETASLEAASIVVGDFSKANFREVAPKYFQHHSAHTLDHCYSPICEAYKALTRPPFGKSDHLSILLLPTYRQKLKRVPPTIREVHHWSDQSDSTLQDSFDNTDWEMFCKASNNNTDEYADSVTGFIKKCIEDVVPTKTVRVYPNQKPWLSCEVRAALNTRTAAFKSGNTDDYKKASYALCMIIRAAKREYSAKVESQFNTTNTRSLWEGLNTITDFEGNSFCE